ncbi:iron-containing alcohol dehydrogenase [Spirochaetota bacterium]
MEINWFCPVRLVFGEGSVKNTGKLLLESKVKSVLLVSGSTYTKRSEGYKAICASLEGVGITYSEFGGVKPDPDQDQVRAVVELLKKDGHLALLAYGGGSPMDCAKSAALSFANEMDILDIVYGRKIAQKPALPVFAVPTTAGTGSEMSSAAVTTDSNAGKKLGFSHPSFFPKIAIVDPELQYSMPPGLTAATGMDALTHAVESFLSIASNPVSEAINLKVVSLIGGSLLKAFADGNNAKARADMALAAAIAGMSFAQTGLGMVHGFAHPVGARLGAAHGEANAVLLPFLLAAYIGHSDAKMAQLAKAMAPENDGSPKSLVDKVIAMNKAMGIPGSVKALSEKHGIAAAVAEKLAPQIVADASTYRSRANNPRAFSDDELGKLFAFALKGDIGAVAGL